MTVLKCPVCGETLKMLTVGSSMEGNEVVNFFSYGCPKDASHINLFETTDETALQQDISALTEYAESIAISNYKMTDLIKSDTDAAKLFDAIDVSDIDKDYTQAFNLPQPADIKSKQDTLKEIIEMAGRNLTLKEIAVAIYRLKDTATRFKNLYDYLLTLNKTTGEYTAKDGEDRLSSLLYGMGTTHNLYFYDNRTYGFPKDTIDF